jgi:C-terminal processing protease CtpA/Prc
VSNARTGRAPIPPTGAALEGSIALIAIPGFAGGDQRAQADFAAGLHDMVRSLEPGAACGWIVDLRDNSGGNLWPMLAGIGPLLGDGEAVAAVYPDGDRQSLWYVDGKAGLGDYVQLRVNSPFETALDAPIAVLTDDETASSAEILVAALRADPRTRLFGRPTRGVSTGTRTLPLSDGAALILTVAATSDPRGRIYDGPIEPDVVVAAGEARGAPSAPIASQPDVRAAHAWLATQCRR